jgi:hypothetical protein
MASYRSGGTVWVRLATRRRGGCRLKQKSSEHILLYCKLDTSILNYMNKSFYQMLVTLSFGIESYGRLNIM